MRAGILGGKVQVHDNHDDNRKDGKWLKKFRFYPRRLKRDAVCGIKFAVWSAQNHFCTITKCKEGTKLHQEEKFAGVFINSFTSFGITDWVNSTWARANNCTVYSWRHVTMKTANSLLITGKTNGKPCHVKIDRWKSFCLLFMINFLFHQIAIQNTETHSQVSTFNFPKQLSLVFCASHHNPVIYNIISQLITPRGLISRLHNCVPGEETFLLFERST